MFSVCLSVHQGGGEGGTPVPGFRFLPFLWSQVLSGREGGEGVAQVPGLFLGGGEGIPQSGPWSGYPPPPPPPPPQQHTPWTGYAADGMPLAITQEDFLV